jgi:N-methylhydantoinase A
MTYRLGVDIGGTFTDFALLDETGRTLRTLKVLSRPDDPGAEVIEGLRQIERRFGIRPAEIRYFTHGTTVGVNTVIQRRGATLALFVTQGFEDVLEVARLKMPDPYDLFSRRPAPLVPRERVWGIAERTLADGSILTPVDEAGVRDAVAAARAEGADAVVIALLNAYANPANERRVGDIVRAAAPDLDVILATDVWPVIREYERTVTATVAGYVRRRVANYLTSLQRALRAAGVAVEPMITKSNGGVMRAELGRRNPIQMLLSGTASGVIGAARVAERAGARHVLSFDVGGTSADVALIFDGRPRFGAGEMVGDFPIHIPTVSVSSIGAGGGSLARVDDHGVLKVGPESAGANPGPACYGLGGTQATITDAYAVAGFLGDGDIGYGAVRLDIARARAAIAPIARRLDLSLEAAAEAIIKVSISGMFLEISKLLSRAGADPRDFTLLPFGGAGPMTACLLARDLGIRRIIVPPTPGVLAAYGGLVADVRNDFIRSAFVDCDLSGVRRLAVLMEDLERQGRAWLRDDQGFAGEPRLRWSADMRYRGQSYEIEVPIEPGWLERADISALSSAFHQEHARLYEHADPDASVQIINLRLVATGPVWADEPGGTEVKAGFDPKPQASIHVFYDGGWHAAAIYERHALGPGARLLGPAVIRQDDSTTCVVGGFAVRTDADLNLHITSTSDEA